MSYIGKTPTSVPLTSSDITDGIISTAKIADDAVTAIKADFDPGKVLQVVSATKTDTFTSSSTSFTDITGITASITPSASDSKILVLVNWNSGGANGYKYGFKLVRGATDISIGDAASSRKRASVGLLSQSTISFESNNIMYLDSPSTTSATTYKLQGFTEGSSFSVNRTNTDTDASSHMRTASNITLIEVGA